MRGGVEYGVAVDLELQREDGRVLVRQEGIHDTRLRAADPAFELFANVRLNLGGITGPLTAVLIFRDAMSDRTARVPLYFEIAE